VTSYPKAGPRTLSDSHGRMLFEGSGIDPEIARERGYYTARRRHEVPEEFADYQRRLGLVIPTYSPDGETVGHQLRPNKPRTSKLKYESPQRSRVILDVHPRMREEVRSGSGDLFVVEGSKKGDALVSQGAAAVALTGVWMAHVPKSKPKRLLPCWDHVRTKGRRVFIVFDSDWRRNDTVHDGLEWLVGALEECGADVRVAYLEDAPDGSKVGADDYLVGGTVAELKALCRRFERQDVGRIRLSKDEKLRALSTDLRHTFWTTEWKGMGAHSSRDVLLKLIEAAERYGKIHPDGLRVKKAQGPLALEVKVSGRTLWKALNRLEEWGLIYRDNKDRKRDRCGAFVLLCTPRAKVSHEGRMHAAADKATTTTSPTREAAFDAGDLPLRGPRQRWSTPARKRQPRYGMIPDTRQIRSKPTTEERVRDEKLAGIKRLGKIRGAIVDVLETSGGSATLQEIADILHRTRPRDIRRRILPMLEVAGIIDVDDSGQVALTADWIEALERDRDATLDERDRRAYERKRDGFRANLAGVSEAGKQAVKESREKREEHLKDHPTPEPDPEPPPLSPLAVAMRDYLDRCPRDARHPPGWIGTTLWAYELFDGKPTPEESEAALRELGVAAYLEEKLQEARRSA
jgi:hypothetical protein